MSTPKDTAEAPALSPDIVKTLEDLLPSFKSQAQMATEIGVSPTQLSRALKEGGEFKYNIPEFEGKVRQFLTNLGKFRKATDELVTTGFLVQPMADFLTTTHLTKDIGVAWSPAGYGKTKGIEAFAAKNPACIVITARKSLCGWRAVRNAILSGLSSRRAKRETSDEFLQRTFVESGRLLIIDNGHLLTESARQWLAYDWHGETGCPLALVGNEAIKDQWSRNDQHQSRVGLACSVEPTVSAADTAAAMLRLYLPDAATDKPTLRLAEKVLKSKGACRALKKHALLTRELIKDPAFRTASAAFKAAHTQLLHSPDLNLDAA